MCGHSGRCARHPPCMRGPPCRLRAAPQLSEWSLRPTTAIRTRRCPPLRSLSGPSPSHPLCCLATVLRIRASNPLHGPQVSEWSLRKCAASSLDVIAGTFREGILPHLLPELQARLSSTDWPVREVSGAPRPHDPTTVRDDDLTTVRDDPAPLAILPHPLPELQARLSRVTCAEGGAATGATNHTRTPQPTQQSTPRHKQRTTP